MKRITSPKQIKKGCHVKEVPSEKFSFYKKDDCYVVYRVLEIKNNTVKIKILNASYHYNFTGDGIIYMDVDDFFDNWKYYKHYKLTKTELFAEIL